MISSGGFRAIDRSSVESAAWITAGTSYGLASISRTVCCADWVDSTPTSKRTSSLRGK